MRKSHKAADFAAAGVLELIIALPLADEHRMPLLTAALAMVMASGRERVLQAALANHPGNEKYVLAAMSVLDQQLADDPTHFLHDVLPAPGGADGENDATDADSAGCASDVGS